MARTLSHKFEDTIHFCRGRKEMTVQEFLYFIGPYGSAVLTFIFSIPFVLWAFIPILNTVLGFIIVISGLRIALNKPIWVPKFLRKKKMSGDKWAHFLVKFVKPLKKFEKIIHPRGTIYQQSPFLQTFNGFILSLCGFFLFLPLHPMVNFLPGITVLMLSIGILEEDLWIMVLSYLILIARIIFLFLPEAAPIP